jgi:hypothetical protein
MKSTPFREELDLAPTPFGREHRLAAKGLKEKGLPWRPHVGCFVWDEAGVIEVPSPFPDRIYFVLNLGHFLRSFGTLEDMVEKLIWLPTWHQARLICKEMGMADMEVWEALCSAKFATVGSELLVMYDLILNRLEE